MLTQELIGFIKEALAAGKSNDWIRGELIGNGGWSERDVNEAFENLGSFRSEPEPAPKQPEPVIINPNPVAASQAEAVVQPAPLQYKSPFRPDAEDLPSSANSGQGFAK